MARRFPDLPIPHHFLFLSRHFGTGVLIATAFIHLLPTAFVSLTDPCLPDFWNKSYPPMAGAIAMLAVFAVVAIEMFFATRGAGHTHETEWTKVPQKDDSAGPHLPIHEPHVDEDVQLQTMPSPFQDSPAPNGHISSPHTRQSIDSDSDLDLTDLDPMDSESAQLANPRAHKTKPSLPDRQHSHTHHPTHPEENPKKLFLQCLLLEAGILFHSIFIGMSVSVAEGTAFIVLLIAICFHQTFEGFALGARIAALIPALFPASSPKPWLMALAYGTTTPIGQAIGIWMHNLYDPASQAGLLMVGITNSISSGLLLFAGLVQLVAEDFLSDRSYETLRGRRRLEACAAVALGGLLMGIVGAFA